MEITAPLSTNDINATLNLLPTYSQEAKKIIGDLRTRLTNLCKNTTGFVTRKDIFGQASLKDSEQFYREKYILKSLISKRLIIEQKGKKSGNFRATFLENRYKLDRSAIVAFSVSDDSLRTLLWPTGTFKTYSFSEENQGKVPLSLKLVDVPAPLKSEDVSTNPVVVSEEPTVDLHTAPKTEEKTQDNIKDIESFFQTNFGVSVQDYLNGMVRVTTKLGEAMILTREGTEQRLDKLEDSVRTLTAEIKSLNTSVQTLAALWKS